MVLFNDEPPPITFLQQDINLGIAVMEGLRLQRTTSPTRAAKKSCQFYCDFVGLTFFKVFTFLLIFLCHESATIPRS